MNTYASPLRTESGAFFSATLGTNAASNWNSPSMTNDWFFSFAISRASVTFSVSGDLADPFVEKLNIAIRGSTSNNEAVFALSLAIYAKSSASGELLIAQSANIYRSSSRTITNTPVVRLTPSFVLIICNAGLTVSAVE